MPSRYARIQRPSALPSFCLVVVPFFLFAALAAVFHPGPARGVNNTVPPAAAVGRSPAEQSGVTVPAGIIACSGEKEGAAVSMEINNATTPPAGPSSITQAPVESVTQPPVGGAVIYDYDRPVPAAGIPLAEDYFQDAVFIGDSRTEGFQLYSGPQNATYYHSKGLTVDTLFSRKVVNTASGTFTVMEALQHKPFKQVYIMLGINELGWAYSDLFIKKYKEVIAGIRNIAPQAQIYVQSILPVTEKRSQSDAIYNNANIARYNELIQQMAAEEKLYYLDVAQCVSDQKGNLCSDASTDGIHLKKQYCDLWLDYLRHHYVAQE